MRSSISPYIFSAALIQVTFCSAACDPKVVNGEASFQCDGARARIQTSDRAIIEWEAFSIAEGEEVSFYLPDPQGAVLNRVVGGNPSEIHGRLESNGSVYLINPQGIVIGKDGVIETGSFLGSTLDCANEDFIAAREIKFFGDGGSVDNQGTIVARGEIALLAQMIKNEGLLDAPAGKVAVGAGREIYYLPDGDERISISLTALVGELEADSRGIDQRGKIQALSAELKADGNLYAYAIKNDGWIDAGEEIVVVGEGGFVEHAGRIEGEDVRVLGKFVYLKDQAIIDVSGLDGGGTVLVGGDYQGSNPLILNATAVVVDKGVEIFADALENGNGGKVIVWADEATGFSGRIYARGGEISGDGGFVEVSGKQDLDFRGLVNTLAPQGNNGTLLLDPTDITISTAATDAGITFGGACGATTYCNTGVTSPRNINNAEIIANLALGNVTINSTPGGPGGGAGDITFSAGSPFTWAAGNNIFTLNARRRIVFNANFTNSTTSGSFICNAGLGAVGGGATIEIATGVTVSQSSAGNLTFSANSTAASTITLTGTGAISTSGGTNLNMIASGAITLGTITPTGTGTITITSGGVLTLGSAFATSATGGFCALQGASVTINAALTHNSAGQDMSIIASTTTIASVGGSITTAAASGNLRLSANTSIASSPTIVHNSTAGNLTLNANTSMTISADVTNSSSTGTTTFNSGIVNINGSITINSIVTHTSSGNINLTAASTGSDVTINGTLAVSNAALTINVIDDFDLSVGGTITYNSPGKLFTFKGTATTTANFAGTLNLIDYGGINWSTVGGGAITISSVFAPVTGGSIFITAGAALSITNTFTTPAVGGSVTLTGSSLALSGALTHNSAGATLSLNSTTTTIVTSGSGSITVAAAAGDFQFSAFTTATFGMPIVYNSTSGNIQGNANTTITFNGNVSSFSSTGTTILNAGLANTGVITIGVGTTFSHTSTGLLQLASGPTAGSDVTINGTLTVSNSDVIISPTDDFTLGAAGIINYSALGKLLYFQARTTTSVTFTGVVNVTGGNMTVEAIDDITISATTGQVNYNVPGGTLMFTSSGGADPDFVMNGLLNVQNGTLIITTFDDITFAGTSTFIYASPNTLTLTAFGTDGSVTLGGTSNISNGTINVTALTTITLSGTMSYTSPLPFTMTAQTAGIILSGPTTLATAATWTMTAATTLTITDIVVNNGSGDIIATCAGDCTLGDLDTGPIYQFGTAGGTTRLNVGGNFNILASITVGGTATLGNRLAGQFGNIDVTVQGDMLLQSAADNAATIVANGTVNIDVVGDFTISGGMTPTALGYASIESGRGMLITVRNISLTSTSSGPASVIRNSGTGDLTVIAQNDMFITQNVGIHNLSSGVLTLVVDQQAPLPPAIGPGRFFLRSTIEGTGPVRIFTARASQNRFESTGTINGLTFEQGNQIIGVWYLTYAGQGGPPFTIFYKGDATEVATQLNQINVAVSEVIQVIFFWRAMNFASCDKFWYNTLCGRPAGTCLYYRIPFEYTLNEVPISGPCWVNLFEL